MDRELEIPRRECFLVAAILGSSARYPYHSLACLFESSLASRRYFHCCTAAVSASTSRSPGEDFQSSHARLYHFDNTLCNPGGMPLRQKLALSILRIHRVVYALHSLARLAAPCLHIRGMGSARMGVERLPQYQRQLNHGRNVHCNPGPNFEGLEFRFSEDSSTLFWGMFYVQHQNATNHAQILY